MKPLPAGIPEKFKKASEVVTARAEGGEFTAFDRKLFNLLLGNAYKSLGTKQIHRISLSELMGYFEINRADKVRESLERLWSNKIAIDYKDADGMQAQLRCHYLSFNMSQIEGGILEYAFDHILLSFLSHPKVYSIIQLNKVRQFQNPHALKLYEQMVMIFGRIARHHSMTIDEAHAFFEVGESYRARFDRFRERVIEQAVKDVNEIAEFDVTYDVQTAGRGNKAVGLRFNVFPKQAPRLLEAADIRSAGGPRRPRRDGDTLDMFQGMSDRERFTPPALRGDTIEEATRLVGSDANVQDLIEEWYEERARVGFGSDPDEMFLSWVRLRMAKYRDPEIKELDVDAIYDSLIGEH